MVVQLQKNVGIGIIGLGYMGRHHLLALCKLEEDGVPCTVLGVCDTDADRLAFVTRKHPVEITTTNPEELIQNEQIEAVFITTPWPSHRYLAKSVISHAKHLYCEKPLGVDLEETQALSTLSSRAGIINQAGLCLRYQPSLWKAKQIIESGTFGELQFVLLREDSRIPETGSLYQTRLADRLAGRGILWEENIHDIDTLIYLLGDLALEHWEITPSSVLGAEKAVRMGLKTKLDTPVWFCSLWHEIDGRGSSRHLEVFFESGIMVSDYFTSGNILLHAKGREPEMFKKGALRQEYVTAMGFPVELASEKRYPWYAVFSDLAFVRSVANGEQASPSFSEAVGAHRIAEQVYMNP